MRGDYVHWMLTPALIQDVELSSSASWLGNSGGASVKSVAGDEGMYVSCDGCEEG